MPVRAVQLHRWIGYLLLENSIHLVTQFLQETTYYYTKPSNSLNLLIDPRRELSKLSLGGGGGEQKIHSGHSFVRVLWYTTLGGFTLFKSQFMYSLRCLV